MICYTDQRVIDLIFYHFVRWINAIYLIQIHLQSWQYDLPLHLISTHVEQEEVRFEKGMEKNKYFIISPNNANAMIMQRLKKQKCYNMISRCDKIYLFR